MEKQLFQARRWKELGTPIASGKANLTEEELKEAKKMHLKILLSQNVLTKEDYLKRINEFI